MSKPYLLFLSHPLTGHLTPTIRVAAALREAGYSTFFVGPTAHRARIEKSGAIFFPLLGRADFDDIKYYSVDKPPSLGYWTLSWQERALVDGRVTWIETLPDGWASVVDALARLQARDSSRNVMIIAEALFSGLLPLFHGAPLPSGVRRPRTIALSVTVPLLRGAGVPPFGFAASHDASVEGQARAAKLWEAWEASSAPLKARMLAKLREAGAEMTSASMPGPLWAGENYVFHDAVAQLGVPSFFFPRDDWPSNFSMVGVIPAADEPVSGWPNLPPWWQDTIGAARRGEKKLVVVAQGTVEVDPCNLAIPTLEALRHRADDILVVVILGRRAATLPAGYHAPCNARVADYLHYDAVLPHASAWVHNGGYGAVQHGVAHGVPMVTAGEGQDKTENCKRLAWSRAGVDLGTARPRPDQVRVAVESVLDHPRYAERAGVLQKEARDLCTFETIESMVRSLSVI